MRALIRFIGLAGIVCAVTVPVQGQCNWGALPGTIDFGTYSVFGGASNTTTTSGTVTCTGAYTFRVTSTTGGAGVYNPRRLSGVAQYNVYVDAGRTQIWGDGTAGTSIYTFFNLFGTNSFSGSAYGQVPGGQDLAPGLYTDTLTVTLSYRPNGGGAWVNRPGVALQVRMTVTAECRASTFNLTFGNYNPLLGTPVNQSTTVQIYCTRTTPATFALDNGANASGAQKRMRVPATANYLNYTATLASAGGTSTSTLVPINNGVTLNGSIPGSQDVNVGNYIDTLQVVVNY
jgi:spore coat protein U-like protein